jgi:hypothetical protein
MAVSTEAVPLFSDMTEGNMSQETTIVIVIAVALVVGLAVWRGRGLRIRQRAGGGISLDVDPMLPEAPRTKAVVGARLEMAGGQAGNVAGVKLVGPSGIGADADVLSNARLKNAVIGDITGVSIVTTEKKT